MSSKTVKAGRWFRAKVADYIEDGAVEDAVDAYLDELDVVTESDLTSALSDYALSSAVASALEDYVPNNDPAANIAEVTVTGTYETDDDAIETAINSIIAVLIANGLIADSE